MKNLIQNAWKSLVQAHKEVSFNKKALIFFIFVFVITSFYPTDIKYFKNREKNSSDYVYFVEDGLRYTNTVLQGVLPILFADKIGIIQAVYVGIGTTITVHLFKNTFNDITVLGTRIGERPRENGGDYNMPSGHSAMVTSAMAFIMIRYRWIYGVYLVPVAIATMGVRILLKAHTLSAVLSGATLGIMVAMLLTSKYTGSLNPLNIFKVFKSKK